MTGKDIIKYVLTLVIGIVISSVYDGLKEVKANGKDIVSSETQLEQFDKRITRLEEENRKMSDIYVTRREFNVIVDNLNNTLKRVDDNILKLTEKFYENK